MNAQSFAYCGVLNTLAEGLEAYSSLDVLLEHFVSSWMICLCAFGEILSGWPLLGRFVIVPIIVSL